MGRFVHAFGQDDLRVKLGQDLIIAVLGVEIEEVLWAELILLSSKPVQTCQVHLLDVIEGKRGWYGNSASLILTNLEALRIAFGIVKIDHRRRLIRHEVASITVAALVVDLR